MQRWSRKQLRVISLGGLYAVCLVLSLVGLQINPKRALAVACSATTITVAQQSANIFYIEDDETPQLNSAYVAYEVSAGASGSFTDLWVKASSFSDASKLHLATTEDGLYHVGSLASNASARSYFYLTGVATASAQSYDITLYDGHPTYGGSATCIQSVSHSSVDDTISAAANKVTSVVSTAPYVGGNMTITVTGQTGTMGGTGIFAYTPASLADWPADCYVLKDTSITLTGGNTGTTAHKLVLTGLNSATSNYTQVYTFTAACTTTLSTTVAPVNYINSGGTNIKHTDTGTTTYTSIPPIPPAQNTLLLSKSVSPGGSVGGGTATYSLTFTNSAPVAATVDTIRDALPSSPASASYVNGSSTFNGPAAGNPNIAGQQLTWTGTFAVPANGSRVFTYQATLPATNGMYTNSAIAFVGATQIDQTIVTTDNTPATAVYGIGDPNMSTSTKTVSDLDGGDVEHGDTLRYTLTVANSGTLDATGINITDTIDTDTENVSNVIITGCGGSAADASIATQFSVTGVAVNASASCTITFDVTVKNTAADNAAILNTATISAAVEGGVGGSPSSNPMAVALNPNLVVTATENDADNAVTAGQNVTYTITIHNNGLTAATGVDVLDAPAGPVSAIGTISLTNCGSAYTDSSTTTSLDIANVDVGLISDCVITYVATVDAGATGGQTIINSANVGIANQGGNDPAPVSATTLTVGASAPALGVTVTENDADNTVTPGQNVTYTVTISNTGGQTASTSFTDTIPTGMGTPGSFSYTNCGGSASSGYSTPTLTVSNLSVTTSNNCVVTYVVAVSSPLNEGTTLTNSVDVAQASQGGNDLGAASATTLTVDATPNLSTSTKSVSDVNGGTVAPGDTLRYTLTLINSGNGQATGVSATDTVDTDTDSLTNVNRTNCGSSTNSSTSTQLNVTAISIAVGTNCVITFDVTVKSPRNEGTVVANTATVGTAIEGGSGATPSSTSVTVDATPNVTVSSSENDADNTVSPSQAVTYTVTLSNNGSGDGTVTVSDTVGGPTGSIGTVQLTSCGSSYTDNSTGQGLSISGVVVPAGGSCTITYIVTVNAGALGGLTITNAADATTPTEGGTNPSPASASTLTVGGLPAMTVTKIDDDADNVVIPGQTVSYNILIENTGNTAVTTSFIDTIPTGMSAPLNVQFSACGSASDAYAAPDLTISTISVAVGATCTVAYDLSVLSPLNQGTTLINSVDVAQAAEGGSDPAPVVSSTLTVNATPDLSASTKSVSDVDGGTVKPGDTLRYTITVINTGDGRATGVSISDTIAAPTENLANVILADCGNPLDASTTGQLLLSSVSVDVGTDCVITFDVTVTAGAAHGAAIANMAIIGAAAEGGVGASPASATQAVDAIIVDNDGVTSAVETAAPNGGDGNNDGVADSEQSNVTALYDPVTGSYAVLETTGCNGNSDVSVNSESSTKPDAGYAYPAGLMAFKVGCSTLGSTVTVTQYYFTSLDPSTLVARKFDAVSGTYATIATDDISRVTIGGQPAIKITYQLTDGSSLDEDGTVNGEIVDPVGPAVKAASVSLAPNSGFRAIAMTPYFTLVAGGLAVLAIALRMSRKR